MGTTPTPPIALPTGDGQGMEHRDAEHHRLTGENIIRYRTTGIQPPSALYITSDASLIVTAANSIAGQTIVIVAQELLPDGRVMPSQWTMALPSTRAQTSQLFPLTEGFLLNVSVTPTAIPTRRGQTWVSVGIRRGSLNAGVTLQQLIQGYVDTMTGAAWPYSTLQDSLQGRGYTQALVLGNGALGATMYITVPAGANWQVNTIYAYFVASAAVATRQIQLNIDDGANVFFQDMVEATVTASQGQVSTWARLLGYAQTARVNGAVTRGLPDFRLLPGWRIGLAVWSMQSGDQWQNVTTEVEEWLAL